jgi:hypothetical protein
VWHRPSSIEPLNGPEFENFFGQWKRYASCGFILRGDTARVRDTKPLFELRTVSCTAFHGFLHRAIMRFPIFSKFEL